ncbi:YesL family protein [Sporosarcina jiandibaonis]|uniref:YesL family protein n=1 Tax=Sporosarcina jiandibaonis TaxID=2715535 RepID=UPI001556ECCF|nr:DUF624 domain-containing protein [Sporosarcina jiandibaonis]
MRTEGLFGGLYIITEWATRLAVTNLLWLFFNIPIIFVGLNLLFTDTTGEFIFFSAIIMIMLPFFFFPATTAMFAVVRRWVLNEEDIPLVRSFWKYYKENYVRSMLGGFVIVLIWAILLIDYFYFVNFVNEFLKYFFYALFFFVAMFTIHFFSNTVHFQTKLQISLKNALYMTLKNPIISLVVTLMNIIIVIISLKIAPFLILFFTASIITCISSFAFFKVSLQQKPS